MSGSKRLAVSATAIVMLATLPSALAAPALGEELPIARVVFAAPQTCVADDADAIPPAAMIRQEDGSALGGVSVAWTWRAGDASGTRLTTTDVNGVVELPAVDISGAGVRWNAKVVSTEHRTPAAQADTLRLSDSSSAGQIGWWAFGPKPFRAGAPVSGEGVKRLLAGDGCPTTAPSGIVTIEARLSGNSGGWTPMGAARVEADGTWTSDVAPPDVGTWHVRASVAQPGRVPAFASGSRTFAVAREETFLETATSSPGQERVAGFGAMHAMSWTLVHLQRNPLRAVVDEPRTADLTFVPRGGSPQAVATLTARTVGGAITFSTKQRVTKSGEFVLRFRGTSRELASSNFLRLYLQPRAKGWPVAAKTYRRTTKVKRTIQLFDYDGAAVYLNARRGPEEVRRRLKVTRAANGRGSAVITFPRAHRGRWTYTLEGVFGPTGRAPLPAWRVTRR